MEIDDVDLFPEVKSREDARFALCEEWSNKRLACALDDLDMYDKDRTWRKDRYDWRWDLCSAYGSAAYGNFASEKVYKEICKRWRAGICLP